jgi:hypothetical protein
MEESEKEEYNADLDLTQQSQLQHDKEEQVEHEIAGKYFTLYY